MSRSSSPALTERVLAEHAALDHAIEIIQTVCQIAGSSNLLSDASNEFARRGLSKAVRTNDTRPLFDWLIEIFSFQGISDQVAASYIRTHGSARWLDIASALTSGPSCPRLESYWTFEGCAYQKAPRCCAEPDHIADCPLPRHPLRNGRLNQTGYSLFLFVRDIAKGDLVGWIDKQLTLSEATVENLIAPLRHVFGVSDKVLSMALSTLLIGARKEKPVWFKTGTQMIAVDTLVHNFMHRTGILHRFARDHAYGPACYSEGCCADIIRQAAAIIDARQFCPNYPKEFARFVQHAIWRFCAADGLGICNGNMIDDAGPCTISFCRNFEKCDHITLMPNRIA